MHQHEQEAQKLAYGCIVIKDGPVHSACNDMQCEMQTLYKHCIIPQGFS